MPEIEIDHTPIKRIKILDVTQLSLTELAKRVQAMTQLRRPTMLSWAEGVAFLSIPLHYDSDILVKKHLEGEIVIQNHEETVSRLLSEGKFSMPVMVATSPFAVYLRRYMLDNPAILAVCAAEGLLGASVREYQEVVCCIAAGDNGA